MHRALLAAGQLWITRRGSSISSLSSVRRGIPVAVTEPYKDIYVSMYCFLLIIKCKPGPAAKNIIFILIALSRCATVHVNPAFTTDR